MVLALHYTIGIKNDTIALLSSRQLKWGATWVFGHLVPLGLASVSHHAASIINGTAAFLKLRQLKWGAKYPLSCDATGITIWLALVMLSCDATALGSESCGVDSTIKMTKMRCTWLFGDVTPLEPLLASGDANSTINGINAFHMSW